MSDSEKPGRPDPEAGGEQPAGTADDTAQFDAPRTDEAPRAYSQSPRPETARFDELPPTDQYPAGDGFQPIPPGPPSGPPSGVVASSPAKRGRGKIIAFSALAVIIVVIIGLVGSELYLRNKTQDCLQNAFSELTGAETSVSLSRKPILLQGLGKDIPFVQVDTKDQPGQMRLHGRAENIKADGDNSTIGSLVGTGYVPFDRVETMSKSAATGADTSGNGTDPSGTGLMQGASIDSITGNAADGTMEVNSTVQIAILPVPVSTTIRPTLNNGRVHFEVVKANAFIFGIPSDFAQQVVDSVTTSMFGPFFDEVTVKSLKVTDQGVDFAVDGRDVALQGQMSGDSGNCSVV
ncbi:LmeA family phospholipid-binding protein [Gordonia sp. CPCC 206044]|uniref:LmeA family phospholipid-binding protein n=1 Tax=Gordonia sp. CPCC 206044 TaxID=3140793 RepID=UPI003AF393CD